mgnify:CR=1 FL=1
MLIICNGTFKSGSSWLHAILLEIFRVKKIHIDNIPEKYNPNTKSPTRILEKNLPYFLQDEDCTQLNYITKAHYFSKQIILESYPNDVKFIFIESKRYKIIFTGGLSYLFKKGMNYNVFIDQDITIKGLLKVIKLI